MQTYRVRVHLGGAWRYWWQVSGPAMARIVEVATGAGLAVDVARNNPRGA